MTLLWDLYEIRADEAVLHGVKLRGRIRKYSIENDITCLVENASDEENIVRFALIAGADPSPVSSFITSLLEKATVAKLLTRVPNPVLSKLKVNDMSRYEA